MKGRELQTKKQTATISGKNKKQTAAIYGKVSYSKPTRTFAISMLHDVIVGQIPFQSHFHLEQIS